MGTPSTVAEDGQRRFAHGVRQHRDVIHGTPARRRRRSAAHVAYQFTKPGRAEKPSATDGGAPAGAFGINLLPLAGTPTKLRAVLRRLPPHHWDGSGMFHAAGGSPTDQLCNRSTTAPMHHPAGRRREPLAEPTPCQASAQLGRNRQDLGLFRNSWGNQIRSIVPARWKEATSRWIEAGNNPTAFVSAADMLAAPNRWYAACAPGTAEPLPGRTIG